MSELLRVLDSNLSLIKTNDPQPILDVGVRGEAKSDHYKQQ